MRAFGNSPARLTTLMLTLIVASCSTVAPQTPAATIPPTLAPLTPNTTLTATRIPPTRTPIASTGAVTLTLWTSEDFLVGTLLRNQLDAFTAANPNIAIDIALKKSTGKGGLLDSLQTTLAVVPALAPDLITLDLSEVPAAIESNSLQSFDALLPAELQNDFFPFASKATRYRNQWLAVPFAADAQHLVFNKTSIKKMPATWDEVLKQRTPLLLPLGGDDADWLQYAALTASTELTLPVDANGAAQVLGFFKRARDLGVLNDAALGAKSVDEAWNLFVAGQLPAAQVSASRYITEREKFPNVQFAAIPTRDGKIASIATGWAFALTTRDAARQIASAKLIVWLMQAERLAPWLRAMHRVPATRSAIFIAVDPPDYSIFMRDHLERATLISRTPVFNKISEAWRAAVVNVSRGQTTAEDAARSLAAIK